MFRRMFSLVVLCFVENGICFIIGKKLSKNWLKTSIFSQHPELLVASYNQNEAAPQDPDGIALIWNMKYHKQTPEYIFHNQVRRLCYLFYVGIVLRDCAGILCFIQLCDAVFSDAEIKSIFVPNLTHCSLLLLIYTSWKHR